MASKPLPRSPSWPNRTNASASGRPPWSPYAEGSTAPTLQQVREHLAAAGLARQKWPASIHEVREFPRTASGKVQKFRLRQLLAEGSRGPGDPENMILEN